MTITELKALMLAATPGPRRLVMDEPYELAIEIAGSRFAKVWLDDAPVEDYNLRQRNDAAYIAALSPEYVAKLIACVEAADALRDDLMWKDHERVCGFYDAARAALDADP